MLSFLLRWALGCRHVLLPNDCIIAVRRLAHLDGPSGLADAVALFFLLPLILLELSIRVLSIRG
jgi:hypothetical protein